MGFDYWLKRVPESGGKEGFFFFFFFPMRWKWGEEEEEEEPVFIG